MDVSMSTHSVHRQSRAQSKPNGFQSTFNKLPSISICCVCTSNTFNSFGSLCGKLRRNCELSEPTLSKNVNGRWMPKMTQMATCVCASYTWKTREVPVNLVSIKCCRVSFSHSQLECTSGSTVFAVLYRVDAFQFELFHLIYIILIAFRLYWFFFIKCLFLAPAMLSYSRVFPPSYVRVDLTGPVCYAICTISGGCRITPKRVQCQACAFVFAFNFIRLLLIFNLSANTEAMKKKNLHNPTRIERKCVLNEFAALVFWPLCTISWLLLDVPDFMACDFRRFSVSIEFFRGV